MTAVISNLKKIGLKVRAGEGKGDYMFSSGEPFVFIFGAASEGLCVFEALLDGKCVGEKVTIKAEQSELTSVFGHLYRPLMQFLGLAIQPRQLHLDITVASIDDPREKEVIQAMAATVGHSCGAGCDCGCH
ncbi:MAG TPA: hypothetical protein VJ969_05125 [Desulfopila sp.]|nr:hypothetical protein [Desulfopila sp.]